MLKYKRIRNPAALSRLPGGSFGLERPDATTLFSLGSFQVTSNLRPAQLGSPAFPSAPTGIIAQHLTLADLQIASLEEARRALRFNRQLRLPFDPAELSGYGAFGSIRLRLTAARQAVLAAFPAGLVAEPVRPDGSVVSTVGSYDYSILTGLTTCTLTTDTLFNPFGLNLHQSGTETRPGQPDLLAAPAEYVLVVGEDGPQVVEYPLVTVIGLTNTQTALLSLVVQGAPFQPYVSGGTSLGLRLLIRPAGSRARAQLRGGKGVGELGLYLLGGTAAPSPGGESCVFRLPVESESFAESDPLVEEITLDWPRPDGYNLAQDGPSYQTYAEALDNLGEALDGYKSDLLRERFAPPDSLLALDQTTGEKQTALLRVWGAQLDDTKRFIDALSRIHHLDYQPARSLPEQLTRNLAATLGWRVMPLLDEDQLLARLYAPPTAGDGATAGASTLPPDLDTELWRRLALNTHWFFRSKGTRAAVRTVLTLLGVPDDLLIIDQHVYLLTPPVGGVQPSLVDASADIGYGGVDLSRLPFTPPVYQNIGSEGNYLDHYRAQGYRLRRVVDNYKVWSRPTPTQIASGYVREDTLSGTRYEVPPNARVLPSKELSLSVSAARAWNGSFYTYAKANGLPVGTSGSVPVGSLRQRQDFNPADGESPTLAAFCERLLRNFIDARSFKTSVDYPTLRGLLHAYQQQQPAPPRLNLRGLIAYSGRINRYWQQLVTQLIPATTILTQRGVTISNPVLSPSKHRFRRGVSVGSEFVFPVHVPLGTAIYVYQLSADITLPLEATMYGFELRGSVETGQTVIRTALRHLRPRPRLRAETLSFTFPAAVPTGLVPLVDSVSVPPGVVLDFNAGGDKNFTLTVPTTAITPSSTTQPAPFVLGYGLFEVGSGNTQRLIRRELVQASDFTVTAAQATLSRSVALSQLLADREYLVKVFFRSLLSRGTAAQVPPRPWDVSERFRFEQYPALYRSHPKFVDPVATPAPLAVTNEQNGPLPGTYFNGYRPGTDFYFPSVIAPAVPVFTANGGVRPVEFFTETLAAPVAGGNLADLRLTYRAFTPPVFSLGGVPLSLANGDYVPLYPDGHPLANQAFRLRVVAGPGSILTARYRTAYQGLTLMRESYSLQGNGGLGPQLIDMGAGQQPPVGARFFQVGPAGSTVPQALAFAVAAAPLAGSLSLLVSGQPNQSAPLESLTIPGGTVLRQSGYVFLLWSLNTPPDLNRDYQLTYGGLDVATPDTIALGSTRWPLSWSWTDRYAADQLVPVGRVSQNYVVETALSTDYDFSGSVIPLAQVPFTVAAAGVGAATVDLSQVAGLSAGQTYLVRVRAAKQLRLVNGTTLTRSSAGGVYRFSVPGAIVPIENLAGVNRYIFVSNQDLTRADLFADSALLGFLNGVPGAAQPTYSRLSGPAIYAPRNGQYVYFCFDTRLLDPAAGSLGVHFLHNGLPNNAYQVRDFTYQDAQGVGRLLRILRTGNQLNADITIQTS